MKRCEMWIEDEYGDVWNMDKFAGLERCDLSKQGKFCIRFLTYNKDFPDVCLMTCESNKELNDKFKEIKQALLTEKTYLPY